VAIVAGACVLAYATSQHAGGSPQRATAGILAALGAGLLWGTMYVPYRKAYLSGMNPLSFVTVFTVGELVTMSALAVVFRGGLAPLTQEISKARPALFWLFLGGFCWVLGDLFQQYAAKYVGIGRGIPLSNTNQLWGLAWGALVFGELSGRGGSAQALIVAGSVTMILGAIAISAAVAPASEQVSWRRAMTRECERYRLDSRQVEAALAGHDPLAKESRGSGRRWLDIPIVAVAAGIFVWLARVARRPPIAINLMWTVTLVIAMLAFLVFCGALLWRRTRFS